MRKPKFTIALLLALLTVAIYLGVYYKWFIGGSRGDASVVLILKSSNVQLDFWQSVNNGAEAAAKEKGASLVVQGPLAENDADGQMRILEEAIASKPDAIVIAPYEHERLPKLMAEARSAGIRLVSLDAPQDVKGAPIAVASDYAESGRQAGRAAAEATNGKPVVAIISDGPGSSATAERLAGLEQELGGYKDSLNGIYYAQQSEERAYRIAKQLLSDGRTFNAIVAMNEPATLGVAKLLREWKLEGAVRLIGFDSSIEEVGLLESGVLDAAIVRKPFNMGYLGVKTALRAVAGDRVPPETTIESNVITKTNMYTAENQKLLFPFISSNR